MHSPSQKAWNRMPKVQVQQMPRDSWWLCSPDEFAQRQRLEQERMSQTSVTVWQKANGEPVE